MSRSGGLPAGSVWQERHCFSTKPESFGLRRLRRASSTPSSGRKSNNPAKNVLRFLILLWLGLTLLGPEDRVLAARWPVALREQVDPAKLAALGSRRANPRVNRILFYLHEAELDGTTPELALNEALTANATTASVAALTLDVQLQNYQRAVEWGLLTPENLERLKRGEAGVISIGPFAGQKTDVDHIVPFSWAPEAGNSLGNLALLPASQNRSKGNRIGWTEVRHASRLYAAGIIGSRTLWTVRWVFVRPWVGPALVVIFFAWVVIATQSRHGGWSALSRWLRGRRHRTA